MNMALGSSTAPDVSMSSGGSTLTLWACFSQHPISSFISLLRAGRDHSASLSSLSTMYFISLISQGGCLGVLYYFSHNSSKMLLSDTLIEHENQNIVWNSSSKTDCQKWKKYSSMVIYRDTSPGNDLNPHAMCLGAASVSRLGSLGCSCQLLLVMLHLNGLLIS